MESKFFTTSGKNLLVSPLVLEGRSVKSVGTDVFESGQEAMDVVHEVVSVDESEEMFQSFVEVISKQAAIKRIGKFNRIQ